jgi:hypothetical protein
MRANDIWRRGQILKLIFIKMYGGSTTYQDEELQKMIDENIVVIKSLSEK